MGGEGLRFVLLSPSRSRPVLLPFANPRILGGPRPFDREAPVVQREGTAADNRRLSLHGVGASSDKQRTIHGVTFPKFCDIVGAIKGEIGARSGFHFLLDSTFNGHDPYRTPRVCAADGLSGESCQEQRALASLDCKLSSGRGDVNVARRKRAG